MRCPHRFIITTSKVFHVVDRRTDFNMDSMQKDIFESKYSRVEPRYSASAAGVREKRLARERYRSASAWAGLSPVA